MTGDRPRRWRLSAPLVVTVVAVVSVAVATDVSTDAAHLTVPPGIRVGSGVATEVLAGRTRPVASPKPDRSSPPSTLTTTSVPPTSPGGGSPSGAVVVQTIIGPTGVAVGRVSPPTVPVESGGPPSSAAPSSPPPATTVPTTTTTTPVPTTTPRSGGGGGGEGSGDDGKGDDGGHSDDPSTTISTVGPDYPVVTSPGYTPPTSTDS